MKTRVSTVGATARPATGAASLFGASPSLSEPSAPSSAMWSNTAAVLATSASVSGEQSPPLPSLLVPPSTPSSALSPAPVASGFFPRAAKPSSNNLACSSMILSLAFLHCLGSPFADFENNSNISSGNSGDITHPMLSSSGPPAHGTVREDLSP